MQHLRRAHPASPSRKRARSPRRRPSRAGRLALLRPPGKAVLAGRALPSPALALDISTMIAVKAENGCLQVTIPTEGMTPGEVNDSRLSGSVRLRASSAAARLSDARKPLGNWLRTSSPTLVAGERAASSPPRGPSEPGQHRR